ncbi:MAG TPA: HXXEE domain-containing protein [Marmoricola sp.]|nr:HXXEE domain-containing protein [Marmoricola sp.]
MNRAVTWGLLASWVVHDVEEVATIGSYAAAYERRCGRPFAVQPDQMALAVTSIGAVVSVAAARGAASGGRSTMFRQVLLAHAAHSVWHVAASAVTRSYTPGVVTAVAVVAPHGWWALARLRQNRTWTAADQLVQLRTAVPGAALAVVSAQLLARRAVRPRTA